jgi:ABC-type Fe3+ transport system permease subunit
MIRGLGLLLAAPLAGFALEAALGTGGMSLHLRAWGATLVVAGGASAVGLLLGIPVGLALTHSPRMLPRTLTMFPLLLPPVLAAATWLAAGLPVPAGPGCALILGAIYWPVVALLLEASLRRLPADAIEAASLQMSPGLLVRKIVWPHARPALLGAALLVFLLAASEFTVPALFVVPTVSMTVYEEISAFRTRSAAAAALPLLALAVGLAWALRRLPSLPSSSPVRPFLRGPALAAARVVAVLAWTATAVLPALLFGLRAGSFLKNAAMNLEPIGWSLLFSGATAALLIGWSSLGGTGRSRLEPMWLATLVLPGVVAGLGTLKIAERSGLHPWLAPSGALFILALMARFAFVAWLPLREPVERSQIDAAELSGLSRIRIWRSILLPAMLPRAAAAGAVVFVLALGEIGPAVLLAPPGRMTAAQHLFGLMHYGYDGVVATLALFLFGTTALLTWSAMNVGRIRTNRVAG